MDGTAGAVPQAAQGPWYLTTGQRVIGTVAGVAAVILGVIAAISVYPSCIIAGILEIFSGLVLLAFEAPFLVRGLTIFGRIAGFWEHRPQWFKVALYAVLGIVPLLLCTGFSVIIGCIGIIITAILYGMAAVGRKGSAAAPGSMPVGGGGPQFQGDPYRDMDKSGLVESQMYPGAR